MRSATTWRRAAAASSAPTRRPSTTSGAPSPRGRPRASSPTATPVRPQALGSPAPAPRQVFGIGLNYREHAAESGFDAPATEPPVFTKFPSCITGPSGDIEMPAGRQGRLGGRAGRRHRPPRPPGRAGRGPRLRGRLRGRPGRLRARAAAGLDAAAVQHGQVAARLRSDRPLAGHPRRHRRPQRPRARLRGQRRGGAAQPDQPADLLGARADREPLGQRAPAARRRHLHRHPFGRRPRPQPRSAFSPTATC